ncbi:MAG: DUF1360 domain-containing protein [Streptosporangiales bacterium]|nr:DUF1360 domain-containing protein [Streptosporangiales bacterium]MBO0889274.1 DUF1360 domain-containing protein [Acidothermales bacterium]
MSERPADEVKERLQAVRTAYDHEHEQPLAGYAVAIAGYGAFLGALAAGVKVSGARLPRRVPTADVLLGGLAVHKAVRLLAKDAVTSPVRAPFTRFRGPGGSGEVTEEVRGRGLLHVVGEVVSCPFCLAPWAAGAYVAALLAAPRTARVVAGMFGVVGVSDMLQQLYGVLKSSGG